MSHITHIMRSESGLRAQISKWRADGQTIAFVPTMGALHKGHLSLVKLALKKADKLVVSIFVNPAQFAPGEDFSAYPRSDKHDIAQLKAETVDLIYIPRSDSMYKDNHATRLNIAGVAQGLETNHRPIFFDGVALIVTKLLNRVTPDIAIFGEKDYQQLAVVRQLVEDLDMPVKIIGGKIVRDSSGLALSSRNQYFDDVGLKRARQLNVIMRACAKAVTDGQLIKSALSDCSDALLAASLSPVDYVSLVDTKTLQDIETKALEKPARLLIATHCGPVRLIDNCAVKPAR